MGYGAVKGALALINQLQSDYENAKRELEDRVRQDALGRARWKAEAAARQQEAESFVASLFQTDQDAQQIYFDNRLEELIARARSAQLLDVCRQGEVLRKLSPNDHGDALPRLFALADSVDRAMAAGPRHTGRSVEGLTEFFDAFILELQSMPFVGKCAANKDAWIAKAESLRRLSFEQRQVALQALDLLRAKVRRLVREEMHREQERLEVVTARRDRVLDAVAQLRAVADCKGATTDAQAATALLREMPTLVQDPRITARNLDGYLAKASALYDQCKRKLESEVTAAVVNGVITSALLKRGYAVRQISPEGGAGCLVSLDHQIGVEFQVTDTGRIRTEAVALNDDAAEPSGHSEEAVCALVDEIYGDLRKESLPLVESGRHRRNATQRLRVVEQPRTLERPKEPIPAERKLKR